MKRSRAAYASTRLDLGERLRSSSENVTHGKARKAELVGRKAVRLRRELGTFARGPWPARPAMKSAMLVDRSVKRIKWRCRDQRVGDGDAVFVAHADPICARPRAFLVGCLGHEPSASARVRRTRAEWSKRAGGEPGRDADAGRNIT